MSAWQEIRCPRCDKLLFEVFGITAHLLIRIVCKCKRVIQVKEAGLTEVVGDTDPSRFSSPL